MNIFTLFESKDIESVKLGIEVIKTLNKEKEFEDKMGISFERYENLFIGFILPKLEIYSDDETLLRLFKYHWKTIIYKEITIPITVVNMGFFWNKT